MLLIFQKDSCRALMVRMKFDIAERPFVRLQRLMLRLQLDINRMGLIAHFVESYLKLTSKENLVLKSEVTKLESEEAEQVLKLTNQWIEEGKRKGKREGTLEGFRQGKAESDRKTALNMHSKGFDIDMIASVIELPVAEVEQMIAKAAR